MSNQRTQPEYFDYMRVANDAEIRDVDLREIEKLTRTDYPNDRMMFELRMLRTCEAIRSGDATVADALNPDSGPNHSKRAAV